ncbi:IS200/IS605 family element transposase accessory protein TnpB [Verrucomicrobium sp. 3C]|uniref:IS200/IS605 family element transposase accessory protein TnpB n=1 Tax=Verrucomicrobium sp. 3C TaxID=1134055 RepID=UPI00039ADF53|nr:IS200/IS605 family element transposase accessory protein TnpB [Verrucomicrobium sp. 3C]
MSKLPVFTYQTRLSVTPEQASCLDAYAALHGLAQRTLFAKMRAGVPLNELKRSFLRRFGLTARQFNAIRVELEGKIASIQERRPELIEETKGRLKRAEEAIGRLEKKEPGSSLLHQKKRRLAILRTKLDALLADQESGQVRLCFGFRRLFRRQFSLEESGYVDHAAWKKDWQTERSSQFFVLGSKDETAGNQSCQAVAEPDGSLRLRLRLPDGLGGPSKHLVLEGVRFAYGQEAILQALLSASRIVTGTTKTGKLVRKREGSAVSYRFVRDRKGWRVFASVEVKPVSVVTRRLAVAVGIDINEDHLALAETDRFGNLVEIRRIGLNLYGKSEEQAKAAIGDACREIVRACTESGKPLVIQQLDLRKRRAELEAVDSVRARSLSSFSYAKAISMLKAASFRAGVEGIEVNPANTSVIGAVNHAHRHGISSHQGAAYAVARRGLGLSERPSVREAIVPTCNGRLTLTFALPARNRTKPVWSFWAGVRKRLKAAHAAHARSGGNRLSPAPLSPKARALGATRTLPAKLRHANRRQHCSAVVVDDLPWLRNG